MMINNTLCDTFAYIDEKRTGETVLFRLTGRSDFSIAVYLYANGKPFPVDLSMTAECCVTEKRYDTNAAKTMFPCRIGRSGQVYVSVPSGMRTAGKNFFCEINISGTDDSNQIFRFKASSFRLVILN